MKHSSRRRALTVSAVALVVGLGAAGTAVALPGTDLVEGTPCSVTARACVDLASDRAWLIDGGEISYGPVPISHGGAGMETPTGDFGVQRKARDHRSVEFDGAKMPWSVFFAPGGIAFHEGEQDTTSAGCVRLERAAAVIFFHELDVYDRVEVR
ncbi:L,D-transpeptidase [Pseudonocardia sp. NPDC049635]|uniref:L,D-transpeptidase n=1 Tax=Pseudonocardia sp. NPDC049635 TaxID=3155506 RepID=UPI0033FBCA9D